MSGQTTPAQPPLCQAKPCQPSLGGTDRPRDSSSVMNQNERIGQAGLGPKGDTGPRRLRKER